MGERCELSDLLVEQCGCRNHRGGRTPGEEATDVRALLLARPGWNAAIYPGLCARCGSTFGAGTAIYPDLAGDGWIAECCA